MKTIKEILWVRGEGEKEGEGERGGGGRGEEGEGGNIDSGHLVCLSFREQLGGGRGGTVTHQEGSFLSPYPPFISPSFWQRD